ncbi:MAG: hypothetical protein ACTSQC_08240 [Candidatus Heimdallarchaeaceae archaeon]
MMKMNAIILAGHSGKDDLICELENVPKKGFIKLGTKMFIERQVEEFLKCDFVDKIYLAGMAEEEWETDHPVVFVEVEGTIFDKVNVVFKEYIAKEEGHPEFALLLSSDVPLVKSDMIRRFAEKCEEESGGEIDGIFYYPIVEKETMLQKFPDVIRSWIKLKNLDFCGGDLLLIQPLKLLEHKKVIDDLGSQRKSFVGQLIVLDPILVLKFVFKRLSMERLLQFFNKKLLKTDRGMYAPLMLDAEIAMDVDKPEHLEVARKYYEENKNLYE